MPISLHLGAALADALVGAVRLLLVPLIVLIGAWLLRVTRDRERAHVERGGDLLLSRKGVPLAVVLLGSLAAITLVLWTRRGPPELGWTRFPYLDKRWVIAAYWSGVAAVILVPLACAVVVRGGARANGAPSELADASPPRNVLGRACLGIALATLAFGPPWNVAASAVRIDAHEEIHLSGLQAIDRGYTPYLGAASVNYGPGLQLATYAYMRSGERFDVPGFRESFAISLWLSLCIAFAVFFTMLAFVPALVASLLMLLVSPTLLWEWTGAGVLNGMWGWANLLRSLGPFLLAALLFSATRIPRRRGELVVYGAAVGATWALFSYLSQENAPGGLATIALIGAAVAATRTVDGRSLRTLCASGIAGVAVVALPIVAYYLAQGGLAEFWRNYALVPARFLRGYANNPYANPAEYDVLTPAYYALPYVLLALPALALFRFRPFRVVAPLDRDRLLVFVSATALIASLPQAMLRADAWHLIGALFALPLVVTVALFHLPAVVGGDPLRRWVVRSVVLLLFVDLFLPAVMRAPERLLELVAGRARSFTVDAPAATGAQDVVARRLGPALDRAEGVNARLMRDLRDAIGERPALVVIPGSRCPIKYAGYAYFIADLQPGPIWLECTDLVADDGMLARFRDHFREHVEEFGAVVSLGAEAPENGIFEAACPDHERRELGFKATRAYVSLCSGN